MSIIPGIEIAAPERTESSRGSHGSPNRLPALRSSRSRCVVDLPLEPVGQFAPASMNARHASVVIVKPAGTGTPSAVISASPAPLPPSSARPPSQGSSKS